MTMMNTEMIIIIIITNIKRYIEKKIVQMNKHYCLFVCLFETEINHHDNKYEIFISLNK